LSHEHEKQKFGEPLGDFSLRDLKGNTVTLSYDLPGGEGGVGQYVIGSFVASGSSQAFTLTGNASTQINALQVRDTTSASVQVYFGTADWFEDLTNYPAQWTYVRQNADGLYINFWQLQHPGFQESEGQPREAAQRLRGRADGP